jgi:hypothetical protein
MNDLRFAAAALAVLLAACSAPAPQARSDAELAAVAPLRRQYPGLVMGFDIRPATTLIVSLDLQQYIDTDDETIAKMKRDTLARWRRTWAAAHPGAHAALQVRFIDFIGRTIATESARV